MTAVATAGQMPPTSATMTMKSWNARTSLASDSSLRKSDSTQAVSYTHLDVYKRQVVVLGSVYTVFVIGESGAKAVWSTRV